MIKFLNFKAQDLRGPVTTTAKLKYDRNHRVYIMREEIPISTPYNEGSGSKASGGLAGDTVKVVAVGMIKVGEKNLYMVVCILVITIGRIWETY